MELVTAKLVVNRYLQISLWSTHFSEAEKQSNRAGNEESAVDVGLQFRQAWITGASGSGACRAADFVNCVTRWMVVSQC